MKRVDICPQCGTTLRWQPPDMVICVMWICPRCKYKRGEGSERNPYKFLRRRKRYV